MCDIDYAEQVFVEKDDFENYLYTEYNQIRDLQIYVLLQRKQRIALRELAVYLLCESPAKRAEPAFYIEPS